MTAAASARPRRRRTAFWAMLLGAALLFVGFLALGAWQLQRLAWKEDLIARLERRLAAEPVRAPQSPQWDSITKAEDEYRRVELQGSFDHARETLVGASTELGTGYWVLTPLRTTQGNWVLINRGFVPPQFKTRASRSATETQGEVEVQGLLRLTEPGGRILRSNDPAAGRWYSRDVEAIARSQQLEGPVAPYFIDASGPTGPNDWPRGGLTVVRFNNHHLGYALTWFVMAAMTAGLAVFLWREDRRPGRRKAPDDAADPA